VRAHGDAEMGSVAQWIGLGTKGREGGAGLAAEQNGCGTRGRHGWAQGRTHGRAEKVPTYFFLHFVLFRGRDRDMLE
jgi:hypothetical protein